MSTAFCRCAKRKCELQAHMTDIADRIKAARIKRGLKQREVADHFDISRASVTQWELGSSRPDAEKIPELERLLNVPRGSILSGDTHNPSLFGGDSTASKSHAEYRPNAEIQGSIATSTVLIPVYGAAVAGENGEFILNGNKIDEVPAPYYLENVDDAYAIRISGESMSPKFEDGETALINPKDIPRRGDYVVAQIQYEDNGLPLAYVKRLVSHTTVELILEQLNPPKRLPAFKSENVVSVHRISGTNF